MIQTAPGFRSGLTLVEVLIAVVVIAVAFAALTASQLSSLRVSRDSELSSQATQHANEVLEVMTQRVLDKYGTYQSCPGIPECTGSEDRGRFTVAYTIERGGGYEAEGLIHLRVEATGPAQVALERYVSCMDVSPPPTVTNPGACG